LKYSEAKEEEGEEKTEISLKKGDPFLFSPIGLL
jgi:hypothetical protein